MYIVMPPNERQEIEVRGMILNTDFITEFIFVKNNIVPCDVILVPGGSHPQLAEKAAKLYIEGMAKYIIFSGRVNPNISEYPSEAEWLKSIAVNLGVPADNVICETEAAHTFDNAKFSLALLDKMDVSIDKVILVCKEYHSRRALLTYQYYFPQNTEFFVSTITDKRGLNRENWTTKIEYIERIMSEVEKIGRYYKDKIATIG